MKQRLWKKIHVDNWSLNFIYAHKYYNVTLAEGRQEVELVDVILAIKYVTNNINDDDGAQISQNHSTSPDPDDPRITSPYADAPSS